MATEVKIPALGESITSGTLASWRVSDGDIVEAGQVLYELETDKITSEGQAEVGGKITLKAAEGDEVDIGQVVAEIDESQAGASSSNSGESKDDLEAALEEDDAPAPEKAKKEAPAEAKQPAAPAQESETQKPSTSDEPAAPLSPAARRVSEEHNIDPASVSGSGKGGRVTKGDLLAALDKKQSEPESKPTPAPTSQPAAKPAAQAQAPSGARTTRKKMSPLRRRIAERLVAAQREAAILTTFNECDMSQVMKTRKQYQEDFVAAHGIKLGFMSFFLKACVKALQEVPGINAQIEGDTVIQNHYYDIGVAVGTEKGLVVPVVRDCDQKSFAEIEQDILNYAKKAREGKITLEDLQGGVFTISNGGIYGSMLSTPILNRPQSGILGMHNIQERPVAVKGEVVIRPMMYLALSYDHRIVDGKEAVTFLIKVKEAIEDPQRLLFGL